jgi:lipid-A-disaccharide synthase
VDFSGFHIPLAKRLKRANPSLKIVYLAPPHCWSWAEWKINDLKKLCDDIVVLYPFEVAWYAARGLTVRYLGSLVYENVMPHYNAALAQQKSIVFMPGSRKREVATLMPLFNEVIKNIKARYPAFEFSTICADSIDLAALEKLSVAPVVRQGAEAYRLVQQALCVVTKPGTVTLELGLLGVPVIAVYKPSWLTYWLARCLVKVRFASLPSIMSNKKIYPEIISPSLSALAIEKEIVDFIEHPEKRAAIKNDLALLREQF